MFANGSYAKLWKIEPVEGKNYYHGQISTSRKNQNGEYETDFSANFVNFVGKAAETASKLKNGDRIHVVNCGVTNSYDKEKKVTYTNYTIFECESANSPGKTQQTEKKTKKTNTKNTSAYNDDDELPFS